MQDKVIAIDGPAGAGKSTIAKRLAERINYTYIDSGAMYRALTLKVLDNGIGMSCEDAIKAMAENSDIDFIDNQILLDGKAVEKEIRSEEVSKNVSHVAAISEVRRIMVEKQRKISKGKNVVMDGRDVGTIIFPEAFLKFFITASVEERARRRYLQLHKNNRLLIECIDQEQLEDIKKQIEKRDYIDTNREDSPLKVAEDAYFIDTSDKGIEEVLDELIVKIKEYGGI